MKMRKLFVLSSICCTLALALGACGDEKQENAKAKAEAEAEALRDAADKAGLILSEDATTVTGVKDKGIKSVVIPNGDTSIGNDAFRGCRSLTSVTIGNGVTSIGNSAFSGCKNLTSITIPDSVTSIGKNAFYGCSSLTSVTIPDSVTSIGDLAFSGVQSVQVSTGNPVFSVDKRGVLINKKEKKLLYAPPSLSGNYTIPDSVTSVGNSAFCGCKDLTSITIPSSVTSIGSGRFPAAPPSRASRSAMASRALGITRLTAAKALRA